MYGNILARCGGSGSVLNRGVNTITSRSSSSSSSSRRRNNNNNRGIMAATTSAGVACTMCHSLRITAACSAGTSLQQHVRTNLSNNHNSNTTARSLTTYNNKGQNHFGNGMNQTVAWDKSIANGCGILRSSPTLLNGAIINSSIQINSSSLLLPSSTFGITQHNLTAAPLSTVATTLSSQEALLNGESSAAVESSWTMQELVGAILFATAATAGSVLLGPIDRLRGKTTGNNGGGGGGNGGDNGGGGSGGGPIGEHRLDSPLNTKEENKEEGDQEMELGLGVATLPRPYEVSVRALRGGRLSMEDEFVVVNGGRLSAVFDGHGGGGVSQYLRDRLHVIISEQLQQQEHAQKPGKFKRMLKGLSGNKNRAQSEGDESTQDFANQSSKKYDISRLGQLPIHSVTKALKNSFDQIDKEILKNDEYEYQGSTAVATVLHEASDGTRTLLSANVGDSRAVLSRKGRAVELTRDHKPNDDREKARILAMGEKIEWDHYCKVHRVRNLSLSRAVGDRFAKPAVSGEVEIKRFPIYDDKDEFILLASDGLWDVLSSQEVVSYVHKRLKAPPKDGAEITSPEDMASLTYLRRKNMSRFIANEALRRGSGDNISVVIVWLNEFDDGNPTV